MESIGGLAVYIKEDNFTKSDENKYFEITAISDVGDRSNQQDSVGFTVNLDSGLFVVCDGMGGHKGGKQASEYAVNRVFSETVLITDETYSLVEKIDEEISGWKDENDEPLNAGTTIAMVSIDKDMLSWLSVGDSRVYLYRNKEMVQITKDHVYEVALEENRRAGLISESFYKKEMNSSDVLISFLGVGGLPLVDTNKVPFKLYKDDVILIMSDGFYKNMTNRTIRKTVEANNTAESISKSLHKTINNDESIENRDNMTLITIKMTRGE